MAVGVRETLLSAWSILSADQSIFSESAAYRPTYAVQRAAKRCAKDPPYFQRYFCGAYQQRNDNASMNVFQDAQQMPPLPDIQNSAQMSCNDLWHALTQPHDPLTIGFLDAAVRLAPLSSIASEMLRSPQHSQSIKAITGKYTIHGHVLPDLAPLDISDLARYVFSWPLVSSPGVLVLLGCKDKLMIFLLYQFYSAIALTLPKIYWWAHQRAEKMISIFREHVSQSDLDPPDHDFVVSRDMVAKAVNFGVEVNETWRQYCRLFAAVSTTRSRVATLVVDEGGSC
jgi:hypothetical protein